MGLRTGVHLNNHTAVGSGGFVNVITADRKTRHALGQHLPLSSTIPLVLSSVKGATVSHETPSEQTKSSGYWCATCLSEPRQDGRSLAGGGGCAGDYLFAGLFRLLVDHADLLQ